MIKDRIGETYFFQDGRTMVIVEYFNTDNISVKFNDGTVVKKTRYYHFKLGNVKNMNTPIIYGFGYFGYGKYSQKLNPKCYAVWKTMLARCYDEKTIKKNPSYIGCSVDKEWHSFQNFAEWYKKNHIHDYQIDKDILKKGNKVYSANNCCFVPKEINVLFTNSKKNRGLYNIGVSRFKRSNKYFAQISKNSINNYLGEFTTEKEAFLAYKKEKEDYIKIMANKYKGKITIKCYNSLINWVVNEND